MNIKDSALTALKYAIGVAATNLASLPAVKAASDIKVNIDLLPVVAWTGVTAFFVAFAALWGVSVLPRNRR